MIYHIFMINEYGLSYSNYTPLTLIINVAILYLAMDILLIYERFGDNLDGYVDPFVLRRVII